MLSVSVIINSCDRCDHLRKLLNALCNQTYGNFEVIVVVGPTTDHTIEMLNSEFKRSVIVESCPVYNLAVSRNIGLQAAKGDVVAYIDDDAIPCPAWLEQIIDVYNTQQVSSVGGQVLSVVPWHSQVQFSRGVVTAFAYQRDVLSESEYNSLNHDIWRTRLMGTNMTFRRKDIIEIGGFDEEYEYLFDDTDICVRLWHSGRKVFFIDGATVYHLPANSRNRVIQSFDINWFSQVKSQIYFLIKNGSVQNKNRVILSLLNTLYLIAKNYAAMVVGRKLPGNLKWKVTRQHLTGSVAGIIRGLTQPRQFLSLSLTPVRRSFQKYLHDCQPDRLLSRNAKPQSRRQKYRTALFVSTNYPLPGTELFDFYNHELLRYLQDDPNEVHLLLPGAVDRAVYDQSAYRHYTQTNNAGQSGGSESSGFINAITRLHCDHHFDYLVISFSDYLKLDLPNRLPLNTIVFFDYKTIDDLTSEADSRIVSYRSATDTISTLLLYPAQRKKEIDRILSLDSTYVEDSIPCRSQLVGRNDDSLDDRIVMYYKRDQKHFSEHCFNKILN